MFAYGLLSVVLVLYLAELGFSGAVIGALLSLTLIGDAVISLIMTTRADRFGRKRHAYDWRWVDAACGTVVRFHE